jgi:hypothetical protein
MSRALQLLNARQWLGAKVLSTVILAIVVFVWLPAPIGAGESEGGGWDTAERLLVVGAIMGMLVPLLTGRGPQGTDRWPILATRLVVGALGVSGLYTYEAAKWSCPYAGERVVIGTTLTDDVGRLYVVKKYGPADIEQHASDACKDIIWEHAGDVPAIWTKSSIDARRSWLKWMYVLAAALWGCAITAAEHAVTLKRTSRVDTEKWREEFQVLSEALPETIDLPIFISYRRDETGAIVGHLQERLQRRFANVFLDTQSLDLGADFKKTIEEHIAGCGALIVVIGPKWIDMTTASGTRRLDDPQDMVRREIIAGLDANVPIIPLLHDTDRMPAAAQLPEPLQPLTAINAGKLRNNPDFETDKDRVLLALFRLAAAREGEGKQQGPEEV